MEKIKQMKENLISVVQAEMMNLANVDTKELGEAIDMIKDLSEACYYTSIVKAMEESEQEKKYENRRYYMPYFPAYEDYPYRAREREYDKQYGRLYYTGGRGGQGSSNNSSGGNRGGSGNQGGNSQGGRSGYEFIDRDNSQMNRDMWRDDREGRSPRARRSYMESKEGHMGKEHQMQELDKYIKELANDVTDMIKDASQEEKILLQQKLNTLASKVMNDNV